MDTFLFRNSAMGSINRKYTGLPPHNSVFIMIDFWITDKWEPQDSLFGTIGNGSHAFFNDKLLSINANLSNWPFNLCKSDVLPMTLVLQVNHVGPDLELTLRNDFKNRAANKEPYGFRNIRILSSMLEISQTSRHVLNPNPRILSTEYDSPCIIGEFYDKTTSTCKTCDSSCSGCFGPTKNDCLSCHRNYIYDGIACLKCDPSCLTCTGTAPNECLSCKQGEFLHMNSTCTNQCNYPYMPNIRNGVVYCEAPCDDSNYFYDNSTCLPTCDSPFEVVLSDSLKRCLFPCNESSYLDWTGSCVTECNSPYLASNHGNYKYCNYPCPPTQQLCNNGICRDSCVPLKTLRIRKPFRLCQSTTINDFEAIDSIIVISDIASHVAILTASIVLVGDPLPILMTISSKMISYIKYFNVYYPAGLVEILKDWKPSFLSNKLSLDPPSELITNTSLQILPPAWIQYNNLQSNFLANFWSELFLLLIFIAVLIFFLLLELIINKIKSKDCYKYLIHNLRMSILNLFIVFICSISGNAVLFAIINFKYEDVTSTLQIVSLVLSIIFLLAVVTFFSFFLYLLIKQDNLRDHGHFSKNKFDEFMEKYSYVGILFQDFKIEFFVQQGFLLFFILRDILCNVIVATMSSYPVVQLILVILFNLGMISYIMTQKPFKKLFDAIRQLVCEVLVFIVNVTVLADSILDDQQIVAQDTRENMGIVIVSVNMAMNVLIVVSAIVKVIMRFTDKKFFSTKALSTRRVYQKSISSSSSRKANISPKVHPDPNIQSKSSLDLGKSTLLHRNSLNKSTSQDIISLNINAPQKENAYERWRKLTSRTKQVNANDRKMNLDESIDLQRDSEVFDKVYQESPQNKARGVRKRSLRRSSLMKERNTTY